MKEYEYERKMTKLTEALTKETEEKRKLMKDKDELNTVSENLEREAEEKCKMIEKLTERISLQEKSTVTEIDLTNDNQSKLERLETEVTDYERANKALKKEAGEKCKMIEKLTKRITFQENSTVENGNWLNWKKLETELKDYERANKALQEQLKLKRFKIAEMETKGNLSSSNKRHGSPSSWEPPSKRHESARMDPADQQRLSSHQKVPHFPSKRDPRIQRRPIVIDGSNVAMLHGLNRVFSTKGVQIAVDYFRQRGHTEITAFVPEFRKKGGQLSDPSIFEKLEKAGVLVYTPSRQVDGQRITPYDDNYILDLAAKNGGIVVTRDNFRDLKAEAQCNPRRQEVIWERILMPTFVKDDIMFSDDPLGRDGPSLDRLLRF